MGPPAAAGFGAEDPAVAYNARRREYLDGAEVGGDDVRVSVMGVDGDNRSGGLEPALAYGSQANEYLIAWDGDTTVAPRVNDEFEVYARRFGAGAPVASASAVCKTLSPVPPPSPGDPNDITLTTVTARSRGARGQKLTSCTPPGYTNESSGE